MGTRVEGNDLVFVLGAHRDARLHAAERLEAREGLLGRIEEVVACGKVRRLGARVGLETLGFALGGLDLAPHRLGLVDPERRLGWEVIEHRDERDSEVGRHPVHALEVDALPHQIAEARALEVLAQAAAVEVLHPSVQILVEEDLARGCQARGRERPDRALRGHVEGADRGDLVAIELHARGVGHPGREDVEEAAAAAHLAHLADLAHGAIARRDQRPHQSA